MDVSTASSFFAILSLACIAGVVAILLLWIATRSVGRGTADAGVGGGGALALRDGLAGAALPVAALVASVASLGSLYYSEVVGFVPCQLCWVQRIFMYPSAIVLVIAAVRRDLGIRAYVVPLALIGGGFSVYHAWLQAYPPSGGSSFCSLEAPCTERHVWEFGFVSLPFMAMTAFAFITAALLAARPQEDPS